MNVEVSFPRRVWLYRPPLSRRVVRRGNDEWGQHTLCVGLPGVLGLVWAYKRCDCPDLAEFDCTFPACPYKAVVAGNPCITHAKDLYDELITG